MGMEQMGQTNNLTNKVNEALEKLGSTSRWNDAPKSLENTESLLGKSVVMVDDMEGVLEGFAPYLVVATGGNASFIQYNGQSLEELTKEIMSTNSDIVLMDYHLSEDDSMKGSDVLRALKENEFTGQSIGFSSDHEATQDFESAGAIGAVKKRPASPERTIQELAAKITS